MHRRIHKNRLLKFINADSRPFGNEEQYTNSFIWCKKGDRGTTCLYCIYMDGPWLIAGPTAAC